MLPPRSHLWSPEYNLAHTGEIRTDLAHGSVGAHLATSPLGARHRAPSGDVCNYPNRHNIGGTRCRWGEVPWASARVLVICIARPRTHGGMSVKKLHLLFVCFVPLLKARPLHRALPISYLRTREHFCACRRNYACTTCRGVGVKAHAPQRMQYQER